MFKSASAVAAAILLAGSSASAQPATPDEAAFRSPNAYADKAG